MPGFGFSIFNLVPTGNVRDVVFSADQSRAYVSLSTGQINVYDVATHSLLTTWTFGTSLGAISITEDGSSLLVVENTYANGNATLYRVNTASGAVTTLNVARSSAFLDVEVVNGTTALLTNVGNFSGLNRFDLTTNSFLQSVSNASNSSVLTESGRYTLLADYALSPGTFSVFDDVTGTIISSERSSLNTVSWGVQAISEARGLIAQFGYFNTVVITNLQLQPQTQFSAQGPIVGMTFSEDGQFLYYYDLNAGNIVKKETTGWTTVETISVGAASWHNNFNNGNELIVSSNGHYILVRNSQSGMLSLIDLTQRNETFAGTSGIDTYVGGPGDDTYFVNLATDVVTELQYEGFDVVTSTASSYTLSPFIERLNLGSGAVSGTGNDQNNVVMGNELANNIDGAGGNDNLSGLAGNDLLAGGAGNDILDGGAGTDTMNGGLGDDLFIVDSTGDIATDDGGLDRVEASATFALGAGVENLTLTGTGAIDGTGNALDNVIIGNAAANSLSGGDGADRLSGGDGNDRIIGGLGADAMDGGLGDDIFVVDASGDTIADSGGIDRVESSVSYTLGVAVENLTLTGTDAIDGTGNALNNVLTGSFGNNVLSGGAGDDALNGGDGNDRLDGGTGADAMDGGLGDDIFIVDGAGDTVTDAGGVDRVESSISYILGAGIENLLLAGATQINGTGNSDDNAIIGNSANNRLDGGAGADQLSGGLGNDIYVVDQQNDIVFENIGGGTDTAESSGNFYLYADVENLILTGSGNNFGVGNELANVLTGNAGENLLIAGAGNDTVNGGAARDAIFGEGGDDILNGDAGIDYIVAGIGNDTLDGGADADEMYGQDGDDIMRGGASFSTDIMVGGTGNDTLFGNSGLGDYDLLYGNEGNDIFYVDTPDDLVFEQGGEGTDTVYADITGAGFYLYANIENLVLLDDTPFGVGNDLNNRMTGNAVGNYLLGGAGNDTLNGMGGNDVLFGEAGSDVFVFGSGNGGDVIGDFTRGQDRLDVSSYGLSFAQLQSRFAQNGNVGAIQFANGDVIVLHNVTMSELTAGDFILNPAAEAPPVDVMDLDKAFVALPDAVALAGNDFNLDGIGLERWGAIRMDLFV